MCSPVGLLAFEGAVLDVFSGAAELGRWFCAARAGLLSFLGRVCRRHGCGGEVVDAAVLLCRLWCGIGEKGGIWEFM